MPHNSAQWVSHIVEGGWATDFGKTLYASPQNGEIRIPFLKTCENIRFYPDRSFGKYSGLYKINPWPIKSPASSNGTVENSFVRYIFDYVRMGSSLAGTRKRMAIVGSNLYDVSLTTDITKIGDITPQSLYPSHMTTFNDLLIIGGGSAPYSWDQTTFQTLAGTPPVFGFSCNHAGRHWAAGVAANPSRLYYSAVGNPEDWVGAGSGSIDIDPGDGDAIVGLLSWKKELWVFKGPYRLSIHRITGTSTSDFARTIFVYGISASGQSSIFPVGDDFAFWSPRGSCHSLTTTVNYGDYEQGYLNYPILSWCRDFSHIGSGFLSNSWQCVSDASQNLSYCLLNNSFVLDSSTTLKPELFIFDWKFKSEDNPYPRIIRLTIDRFTALAMTSGVFDASQLLPTFGVKDGNIKQEYPISNISFSNDGVAYPYTIQTPSLTYGPSTHTKTIMGVSVDLVNNYHRIDNTTGTLTFSVGGRKAPTQSLSFSNVGYTPLGSFTLDADQLGEEGDTPGFAENVYGESPAFTYTMAENSGIGVLYGKDSQVRHFSVLIAPSGESMENS